jgi:hypothetical protein
LSSIMPSFILITLRGRKLRILKRASKGFETVDFGFAREKSKAFFSGKLIRNLEIATNNTVEAPTGLYEKPKGLIIRPKRPGK